MGDEGFRRDLFLDETQYEEGLLRDRKRDLPDLRKGHDEERAKFVRDVIALANSARMLGKAGYLLFGLQNRKPDDAGTASESLIYGIENSVAPYFHDGVGDWLAAREYFCQHANNVIKHHVTPVLPFEVKFGEVEADESKKVAYLKVEPFCPPKPFHVKKELSQLLAIGQCWIRSGESNLEIRPLEISPEDAPFCYAYSQVPYVLPRRWRDYLEGLLTRIPDMVREAPYQELQSIDGRRLSDVFLQFLESEAQVLVIVGGAGTGKTTFVKKQVREIASACLAAVESMIAREEYGPPTLPVPAYFPLTDYRASDLADLERRLLQNENQSSRALWDQEPREPERLFEARGLRWLLCADGLDEIWQEANRGRFISALQAFCARYPGVKVVLTTRPGHPGLVQRPWRAEQVVIAPLSERNILDYVDAQSADSAKRELAEVRSVLSSSKDLLRLCGVPLFLKEAVSEFIGMRPAILSQDQLPVLTSNTGDGIGLPANDGGTSQPGRIGEPPVSAEDFTVPEPTEYRETLEDERSDPELWLDLRVGVLLDRVYTRVWEREVARRALGNLEADRRWQGTGKLALAMDGECETCRLDTARRAMENNVALGWVLNLGILEQCLEMRGMYRFHTNATKAYFAAAYLRSMLGSSLPEEVQRIRLKTRRLSPTFKENVCTILADLSAANVSIVCEGGSSG